MVFIWRPHRHFSRRRTRLSWIGLITLMALWMVLLAACSSSGGVSSSTTSTTISVLNNEFSPEALHIKPGQTEAFDATIHTGGSPLSILRVPEDYPTIQLAV